MQQVKAPLNPDLYKVHTSQANTISLKFVLNTGLELKLHAALSDQSHRVVPNTDGTCSLSFDRLDTK